MSAVAGAAAAVRVAGRQPTPAVGRGGVRIAGLVAVFAEVQHGVLVDAVPQASIEIALLEVAERGAMARHRVGCRGGSRVKQVASVRALGLFDKVNDAVFCLFSFKHAGAAS